MNAKLPTLIIVLGTLGSAPFCWAQSPAPSAPGGPISSLDFQPSGPKVHFASSTFEFGKVKSGEVVKYSFVFTNTGRATLEILAVKPGCGCTTAGTWDKLVEPGKTGAIPLQFNSTGYSGMVAKSAAVTCNDPAQSNVVLQLTGTVWKPIDVTPTMAMFNLSSEAQSNETKVLRIVSNLEEPVVLSELYCGNPSFRAELKEIRPGKEFDLQVTALPPFTNPTSFATITLKTSSTQVPALNLNAYAMVQPPITVLPQQISVPTGFSTNPITSSVTIRNTGAKPLALSEPKLNVPGAKVSVKEVEPGRLFIAQVELPAGFQLRPEEKPELTMRSDHPQFPLLRVPVVGAPMPAATPAAQVAAAPSPAPVPAIKPIIKPITRTVPTRVPTASPVEKWRANKPPQPTSG
jgi:hypothetical protein